MKTEPAICTWLFILIPIGFGLVLHVGKASAADGDGDADVTYIRQRVAANYIEAPTALTNALAVTMDKSVSVRSNDTLSNIISRKYGIGISNSRSAYKTLESYIQERNDIDDPDLIRSNSSILIPDLPPLAKQEPRKENLYNKIPKLNIECHLRSLDEPKLPTPLCANLESATIQTSATKQAAGLSGYLFDTWRKGAQEVWQIRPVTRSIARSLLASAPETYQIDAAPITIKLAQASSQEGWAPLNEGEELLVKSRIAHAATKSPLLIILDDAWPDNKSFLDSKIFFLNAIETVRKRYHMGPPRFSSRVRSATTTAYTNQGLVSIPTPHSASIKTSLEPLMALEPPDGRVRVVYLPLTQVQTYAAEILENLVAINLIAKDLGGRLKDDVPPDLQSTALARAHTFVARTGTTLGSDLKSDQAIVEAVLMFANLLAEFPKRPVLINMSWTVPNLDLPVYVPPDAYGLDVVAAGNEGDNRGTTVYQLKRQFAYRSRYPGDMLAVMNLTPDGSPNCTSSILEIQPDVTGVGFNGSLSDTNCGGTSFAAPRVAWLIAARESVARPDASVEDWLTRIRNELRTMREPEAHNFNKMRLNLSRLFAPIPTN